MIERPATLRLFYLFSKRRSAKTIFKNGVLQSPPWTTSLRLRWEAKPLGEFRWRAVRRRWSTHGSSYSGYQPGKTNHSNKWLQDLKQLNPTQHFEHNNCRIKARAWTKELIDPNPKCRLFWKIDLAAGVYLSEALSPPRFLFRVVKQFCRFGISSNRKIHSV